MACEAGDPLRAEALCERVLGRYRNRELTAAAAGALDRAAIVLGRARGMRIERALAGGCVAVLSRPEDMPASPSDGCYLVQPPMIGLQGRRLGETLGARGVCAVVVTREPMTAGGLWPIVAVGEQSVRARIEPPAGVRRTGEGITGDRLDGAPDAAWFGCAIEAITRAGLDRLDPAEPALWRVGDLLELIWAHRDDAGVCAAMGRACQLALREPTPSSRRARPLIDDPYSF